MEEQNIPIDINTGKLLDWLISRRHVNKDWPNSILPIREKINNAIQDMPAHEGIIKLLSGQHINYFHCLKIVDILKETEADSKNLFGRYGSQRMKDWQDIVSSYQKDNLYLAEAAQILIRNVSYEIPGLKKQLAKLEQTQLDNEKKIKDYGKIESTALKEFNASCEQLGIKGKNIKSELFEMLKELPKIYDDISDKIKLVEPAIDLYKEFNKFLTGVEDVQVLHILSYLVKNGNTTTYEYIYGEKPQKIEIEEIKCEEPESKEKGNEIDFGEDIDFGDNNEIDFGDIIVESQDIDWGTLNTEESFEIVEHVDLDVTLEESGIVVEKAGGVAKGEEALSILDNPKTREQIINNLMELQSFLKLRIYEMASESDLLAMSQMQDAPTALQMQTIESITAFNDTVNVALLQMTSKRVQHLHNVKHSPKYIDILTASLKQKLSVVDRMKANKTLVEKKMKELREEAKNTEPLIKSLISNTKQLQKEIEEEISKKYKGRIVNIVGGVNML